MEVVEVVDNRHIGIVEVVEGKPIEDMVIRIAKIAFEVSHTTMTMGSRHRVDLATDAIVRCKRDTRVEVEKQAVVEDTMTIVGEQMDRR